MQAVMHSLSSPTYTRPMGGTHPQKSAAGELFEADAAVGARSVYVTVVNATDRILKRSDAWLEVRPRRGLHFACNVGGGCWPFHRRSQSRVPPPLCRVQTRT